MLRIFLCILTVLADECLKLKVLRVDVSVAIVDVVHHTRQVMQVD